MARWIGFPDALSQITTVSRWLVMPMAATSVMGRAALRMTSRSTSTEVSKIASASCSTQPSAG